MCKENIPESVETIPFDLILRRGLVYLVDHVSAVDKELTKSGTWEEEQIDFLFSFGRKEFGGSTAAFLDFGSYFGIYTVRASQVDYIDEQYAVEGDPRNFMQLCANIFLNNLERRVSVHNVALSDHVGHVNYRISSTNSENRGGSGVILESDGARAADCIPADHIVALRNRNVICKLDVEGHETHVLRGMSEIIANNDVLLQIEMWDDWPVSYKETTDVVLDLGFELKHRIGPDHYFLRRRIV